VEGALRARLSWCLYDWANSAFALVCMTALLPPLLVAAANQELGSPSGTVAWGWIATAGLAASIAASPFLGAWADRRGQRKRALALLVVAGAVSCGAMGWLLDRSWLGAGLFYVLGASAFSLGNVLYDSLLLGVAPREAWDRLSALGYAAGYLGGALALVLALVLWQRGAHLGAFALVGAWWLFFSLPIWLWVPEPPPGEGSGTWEAVRARFRELASQRNAFRFLVAFWLYNDGIGTVIKMAGAYGSELGIPLGHMVGALLLAQAVGVPATVGFGALAQRIGSKRAILLALGVYTAVAVWAMGIREVWEFWLLAGLVGTVQGGSQALSRSLFATFVPRGAEAGYFAFFDVSGRLAGVAGPALFALATQLAGRPEAGVAVTAGFFLVGAAVLAGVEEPPAVGSGEEGSAGARV
jgi:UMF1 family MFS transporter